MIVWNHSIIPVDNKGILTKIVNRVDEYKKIINNIKPLHQVNKDIKKTRILISRLKNKKEILSTGKYDEEMTQILSDLYQSRISSEKEKLNLELEYKETLKNLHISIKNIKVDLVNEIKTYLSKNGIKISKHKIVLILKENNL